MFIDIHSHILHGVDDGANTIEESIELLKQEKEQGITAVVCTPHFYPEYMALEEHINTTNKAFSELKEAVRSLDLPQLFLGHEVQCYPQIARSSGLELCTINSSYYLLLELPFITAIPKETVREIIRLSDDLGFRIIIAHIERYCYDRQYKNIVSLVKKGLVLAQVNADSLFIPEFKKATEKLLKENLVSFVASDAHSKDIRPVRINRFMEHIKTAYPKSYSRINAECEALIYELNGETYA